MLNEGFLEDAFILHDETEHSFKLIQLLSKLRKKQDVDYQKFHTLSVNRQSDVQNDARYELDKKWSRMRSFMKFQPLRLVKDYFGEVVAFYFAFIGSFISTLWLPSLIGIVFFIIGIVQGYNNMNSVNQVNYTQTAKYLFRIYKRRNAFN